MRAVFAWWNTSLAPSAAKSGPTDAAFASALGYILGVLEDPDVVALGLCEVSLEVVTRLVAALPAGLECLTQVSTVGRARYDLALILRTERVSPVTDLGTLTWTVKKRNFLTGSGVAVELDGTRLYIALSHWPSRLRKPAKDYDRDEYGRGLREKLEEITRTSGQVPMVLMGDYNDDPADQSLARALIATRDRNRAVRLEAFYNPFWRRLGHVGPSIRRRGKDISPAGTYFYRVGYETHWYTFDQVLVSHHFLDGRGWRLQEDDTNILMPDGLLNAVLSKKNRFDHLPVKATFECSL